MSGTLSPVTRGPLRPSLRPLVLSSGAVEILKWTAAALMVGDHINKYLLHGSEPLLFDAGRLAMPLFAIVLGYNLARPQRGPVCPGCSAPGNRGHSRLRAIHRARRSGMGLVAAQHHGHVPCRHRHLLAARFRSSAKDRCSCCALRCGRLVRRVLVARHRVVRRHLELREKAFLARAGRRRPCSVCTSAREWQRLGAGSIRGRPGGDGRAGFVVGASSSPVLLRLLSGAPGAPLDLPARFADPLAGTDMTRLSSHHRRDRPRSRRGAVSDRCAPTASCHGVGNRRPPGRRGDRRQPA